MRETIPPSLDGERVDRVVALLTGLSRSDVAALVTAGGVRIDGRAVGSRAQRVSTGAALDVDVPAPLVEADPEGDPDVEVVVVHADEDVLVIDKPPGLVVHPGAGNRRGTLVHGLLARFPEVATVGDPRRPGIVHRLDKGTSGLLVVARSDRAYEALVQAMAARRVDRVYLALVWGHLRSRRGVVDAPVGRSQRDRTRMAVSERGRPARTAYEVLETFTAPKDLTLLECRLETGRTHQIRVHLAAIGHPVVGDARYGGRRPAVPAPRPFLHAARLGLVHPITGDRLELSSPLPPDLEEIRARLA